MPIVDKIIKQYAEIAIWDVLESENDLIKVVENMGIEYLHLLSNVSNYNKRRERLASLLALNFLTQKNTFYTPGKNGKPILNSTSNKFISISNSHGKVAVMISNVNCGIDLQKKNTEKLIRIAPKFLSERELKLLQPLSQNSDSLHFIWSAKEALFKKINTRGLSFKYHIESENPNIVQNSQSIINYMTEEKIWKKEMVECIVLEDFYMVYTCD